MTHATLPFADRRAAGRALARAVQSLNLPHPVVLALPRGGVPVGFEVARALGAPLDVLIVRKIGAPGNEEFGIGALVDGAHPQLVIDQAMARACGADAAYLEQEKARQLAEIERRRTAYCRDRPEPVAGRDVIVVDDGIATGNTVRAALGALAHAGASRIVLATPIAPQATLNTLRTLCDDVVCLARPEPFSSVGAFYQDFSQTEDAEVIALLAEARRSAPA